VAIINKNKKKLAELEADYQLKNRTISHIVLQPFDEHAKGVPGTHPCTCLLDKRSVIIQFLMLIPLA